MCFKIFRDYTQYSYMGHLVRLVEILPKIRDTTSWQIKDKGHLKKYVKGN